MKTKLIAPKTTTIKIKDAEVAVYKLPEDVQNEIETLDKIRQDYIDKVYEVEILELALKAKISQINSMLETDNKP